ncbi:MAG: tetratricopeptide repeat protein [Pseudomonadota bacterium]
MNDYLSDEQQVEVIRRWWSENGTVILAGVGLGVLGLFGWNRYQAATETTAAEASAVYERLVDAVADGNADLAIASQQELVRDFDGTPYADQAWLAVAKLHMDDGDTEAAAEALRSALTAVDDPTLERVARLRLARVLLYDGAPDEARELIAGVDAGYLDARRNEILGDIELARGDIEAARAAYQAALATPGNPPLIDINLVTMKLNDLPPAAVSDAAEASGEGDS